MQMKYIFIVFMFIIGISFPVQSEEYPPSCVEAQSYYFLVLISYTALELQTLNEKILAAENKLKKIKSETNSLTLHNFPPYTWDPVTCSNNSKGDIECQWSFRNSS